MMEPLANTTTETDREKFLRQLSERYRQPLTAYFQRRVHSCNEAEDLTQEVFLRLVRRLCAWPTNCLQPSWSCALQQASAAASHCGCPQGSMALAAADRG
jgi:DNA-directed RNA polymerase specialized sigma24 family protein